MPSIKSIVRIVLFVLFGTFLHYTLPQHDIARINSTEIIRQDLSGWNSVFYASGDAGNAVQTTRDLRLINTVRKNTWFFGFYKTGGEETMVYRNEDTGWIWPPYFKFDSSDLQAEASDNISQAAEPRWVVITHYGWRNRYISIYPNAISIRPIDNPDVRIIPWFNIFFFVFLIVAILMLRAMWRQFVERMVDPALTSAGNRWDEVEAEYAEKKSRLRRFFSRK